MNIITHPDQLTAQWLTAALKQAGKLSDAVVDRFEYEIIGTGKMGDNARVSLIYSSSETNAPATVIAKFPAEDETARAIAGYRGAYYNEVMFYNNFASRTEIRTPEIYLCKVSEDKMDFIILMEDLSPAIPGDQLIGETLEHCQLAIQEAAKLATAFYGDEDAAMNDYVVSVARDDGGAMGQELLQQNWPAFLERFGHGLNDESKAFGELYCNSFMKYISAFKGIKTLIHADFRSENILFGDDCVYTVDWQTISEGSPLTDIAYFLGGSVYIDDRRAWEKQLITQYSALLNEQGINLSVDECWEQYRAQSMHGLIITILGACFSEADDRGDAMFLTMIQRHLQHCVDMNAADFLK